MEYLIGVIIGCVITNIFYISRCFGELIYNDEDDEDSISVGIAFDGRTNKMIKQKWIRLRVKKVSQEKHRS